MERPVGGKRQGGHDKDDDDHDGGDYLDKDCDDLDGGDHHHDGDHGDHDDYDDNGCIQGDDHYGYAINSIQTGPKDGRPGDPT